MAEAKKAPNGLELSKKWQESTDCRSEILWYLTEQVPQIYCLEAVPHPQEEEKLATDLLLQPLECFLFGEDPHVGLEKLQQDSASSHLCGRVFKEGETTYSCRDCAIDPTCVLCTDCFQNSVHKGHRYKMHASSGGGFCDCGDVEAWKTGPCCPKHDPGATAAMETAVAFWEKVQNIYFECGGSVSKDADHVLEPGLLERAEKLFRVILRYITELLVWEEHDELPIELRPRVHKDTYYCVLYNDEHHSYDHVIYALQRSLQCDHREAHTHTALIDKEGRRAVKRGILRSCLQVKEQIQTNSEQISSEPLRVEILHSAVMAHQSFALRLGSWLQKIIPYSVGFRQLFCQVALEPSQVAGQPSLISQLMLHDSKLYKVARKVIHELIVCSLLMETKYKRLFAIEYTKHYKQLQKDFIIDDHERSISITSLSVQIFTVPTLARQLIEEGNVIKVIVETVMEMLSEHLDGSNRFHFQGHNVDRFYRIQDIFHDLRYILISKPTVWSGELRAQFLEGFRAFLRILASMQGMEEVKRQFGQHVEVEPEWEAGFSIQILLRHILSMLQEWCASDEEVLLQAFKDCHSTLLRCTNQPFHSEATDSYMCKHILNSRPYKVSQEPVSVYLPVSRLLAGLYVHICKSGAVARLQEYLDEMHCDFAYLAEHPLRCLALAAQVSAEMWRRNGLSLVSQVYYYQDVKCRDEMFDKDIIMLQIAGSRMDPNDFVMLVLQRLELFELFNGSYSSKEQDLLKQGNRLMEEMLHLLIVIIGERYVPGISQVTREDVTMREVIHLLCIEPMAHSSLVKGLPENESQETGLESVISRVSTFRKPGVSGHGLYEVKKECLQEFNPFFYHYSKSQHSKAEDAQKKRRAQEGGDKALPPPVPPPFTPPFSGIMRILNCDIFLHILRVVLQKAAEDHAGQWTEAMIQRALHLIGQALLEEKTQLEASSEDEVAFDFSLKARGSGCEHGNSLFQFLTKLKSLCSLEAQKDMIQWTLQMFETIKCLREKSSPTAPTSMEQTKTEESVQNKKAEQKRKAEAAKHRQKIMAQMSAMQKNFIETHKMLYDNLPESGVQGEPSPSMDSSMELSESCVAVGPYRGVACVEREVLTCILCQEEQEVKARGPAMVLAACVQRSAVLTQTRGKGLPSSDSFDPLFMHPDLAVGTHTGSCGHVMHAACWQKYFEAVQNVTRNRLHAESIIDLENGEYMCPLCKSLCNTVIPLIPLEPFPLNNESAQLVGQVLTLPCWTRIIMARVNGLKAAGQDGGGSGSSVAELALGGDEHMDSLSILSFGIQASTKYSDSIGGMLAVCATTVHRVGLKVPPNELDPRVPIMSWNTCAFTIQATENMLQEEAKPLFGSLQNRQLAGLKALVHFSAAHSQKRSQAVIQKHFARMLTVLLPIMNMEGTPCLLEVDCFHLLVGLVLAIPTLYQEAVVDLQPSAISSAYNHLHLLHLVTTAHMVQVLLSSPDTPGIMGGGDGEEARLVSDFLQAVTQHADGWRCLFKKGLSKPRAPSSGVRKYSRWLSSDLQGIADRVRRGMAPFLRCAAIFFNCLTGVPPPKELSSTAVSEEAQMEALCSYLALPSNLFKLFQEHKETVSPLLQRWCGRPEITKTLKGDLPVVRYPRKCNKLVHLPEDYSALLNQACHFQCPKGPMDERKHPALCLFCGAMLCSKSLCCQEQLDGEEVGACTAHAARCGAGVGMFLRIRECEVVLMGSKTRASLYPAPYLDDYGETDPQLRRGNPLHLSPERYRRLHQLWHQHCIMEEIVRSQEVVNAMFGPDWQMF